MKLLLKLLGVSDYIEELENKLFDKEQYYCNRLQEQKEVNNILNKERNDLLSTKTVLTAEVIKLREQLKTLEQSYSEYISLNEKLVKDRNKLLDFKGNVLDAIADLNDIANKEYD